MLPSARWIIYISLYILRWYSAISQQPTATNNNALLFTQMQYFLIGFGNRRHKGARKVIVCVTQMVCRRVYVLYFKYNAHSVHPKSKSTDNNKKMRFVGNPFNGFMPWLVPDWCDSQLSFPDFHHSFNLHVAEEI